MLAKKISSLQHPLVLHWAKLLKDKALRTKNNSCIIAGEKLIQELSKRLSIKALISTKETETIRADDHFIVTEGILKKITGLASPDGYAAEIPLPAPQDLSSSKRLLVLDQIQDPGNLGTLLRSAHALGWDGAVLTPGTVDLFNDKALRAAKGASFYLPFAIENRETIASWKHTHLIADIRGEPLGKSLISPPIALILSSEGHGPYFWPKGKKIFIPMQNGADSLNVASAGAILLYAMRAV